MWTLAVARGTGLLYSLGTIKASQIVVLNKDMYVVVTQQKLI